MRISESWLREWVNPEKNTDELVSQLTMAGLEVDAVEAVAGDFSGVVVGEILSTEQHPDADKLRVCQVAGSPEGTMQVVCGAPNARPGIKIPFALVGSSLPPSEEGGKPFKIKKAKLRGVESFGMLCAQTELQAGDDDDGLWELSVDASVGEDLREYLKLDDSIIEVDLTPNRSDCLGLKGLAREVGVLNKADVNGPAIAPVPPQIDDTFPVELNAGNACPRYIGRVVKGVDVSKPSPLWMQEKLRRSGLRSIDAVVDITNYILLELGQPMHAFDLNKLQGGINVRMAEEGEKLTLLDGQDVELKSNTLLITDGSGPIAMAGIMGGLSTAVKEDTKDIFFEAAFFDPIAIAGKARSYGLHTDSSHRFERGVDYDGAVAAVERATELLIAATGGEPGPIVQQELKELLPERRSVKLLRSKILKGLGFAIPDDEVVDILSRLGLELQSTSEEGWEFSVPSYRFDISIEADLLEELARIYGYNRLPTTEMRIPTSFESKSESVLPGDLLSKHLISRGYQEAITYSFVDPKLQALFEPKVEAVELLNPISADMGVMRTSLVPGLVQSLVYNLNRQQSRVRLYERGLRFVPGDSGVEQSQGIAGVIYGTRDALGWNANKEHVDFYDVKGDVESLLSANFKQVAFTQGGPEYLHPGQSAELVIDGKTVGYLGALHPKIQQEMDIPKAVFVFELDLNEIVGAKVPSFSAVSKFPEVNRDLAIVVDRNVTVAALETEITAHAGDYLKDLKVFDVYSGEGIDPQRKSVAFSLTFQHPSRTLNEDEINNPVATVVKRLEDKFNANLR